MNDTFSSIRVVMTMLERLILEGKGFEVFTRETVAANGDQFYQVTTSPDKYTILYYRKIDPSEARVNFRTYSGWTGGQIEKQFPVIKLRNDGASESQALFSLLSGEIEPDQDDQLVDIGLFGTTGPNISAGTESTEFDLRVIAPGSSFLIWINNESENNSEIVIQYKYVEVTPEFLGQAPAA